MRVVIWIAAVVVVVVQVVTDEDLVAGLGLLADRLCKPSPSVDSGDNFKIPEKRRKQSTQESSAATVAMPTATVMPVAAESQLATNQAALISELSAADWQTLAEAGSSSTVLDPVSRTQSTVFVPVTFANSVAVPRTKKVVLLVAKRPSTSTANQSQNGISIIRSFDDSTLTITSSDCNSMPANYLTTSADSMVARLTTLHTDVPSQELVISCTPGSSGHLELLEGQSGSSEGHLGASYEHLVSSGNLTSLSGLSGPSESHFVSLGHLGSSEGHFGSSLHESNLSSLASKTSVVLRHASTEYEGQDMVDEDEVQTSTPVSVDPHSMVTQLKQFLGVSDLYSCS